MVLKTKTPEFKKEEENEEDGERRKGRRRRRRQLWCQSMDIFKHCVIFFVYFCAILYYVLFKKKDCVI